MIPIAFPEANMNFKAPDDLEESQCATIPAYRGKIAGGSVDGIDVVVVAWLPSSEDLRRLAQGEPIFLSVVGGLPPHFLTTDFYTATHPA